MAALVAAVNPRVKFSDSQIGAILDEVFRTYIEFINGDAGLSLEGLHRTYIDGAGDVDCDFDALRLDLDSDDWESGTSQKAFASSIVDESASSVPLAKRWDNAPAWAVNGIVYEQTWLLVDDLQIIIKRLKTKLAKLKEGRRDDLSSDGGWSRDLSIEPDDNGKPAWEELGQDYTIFHKELMQITHKADAFKTKMELYDAHMAIGRTLFDHMLYKEALSSLKKAFDAEPADPRSQFHMGNTLYCMGRYTAAQNCYVFALNAAEARTDQHNHLLPQIHINLGITLEADGLLFSACEHYRKAVAQEPKHYRALKLLGSAFYGVGEYKAAERALTEAVNLKDDFVDAHCDLGSTLHALKEDENAIHEFQKTLDLKPDHMDALYNLGGLFRDIGRFQRAVDMYSKVLVLQPNHWWAQINKAVALLGAGEADEARKAFKDAFKMTNRVEIYDAIMHLKLTKKKPKGLSSIIKKTDEDAISVPSNISMVTEENILVVEASHFCPVDEKTTPRQWLASALEIRRFQRHTRLYRCDVITMKKEFLESVVLPGGSGTNKSISKEELEKVLYKLLHFLKPDTFQGAMKAINEKILSILDVDNSGQVDIGMLVAITAPLCTGSLERRKRVAYDALLWKSDQESKGEIYRSHAFYYIGLLRAIYLPAVASSMMELQRFDDQTMLNFVQFQEMFDDNDWGFGIIDVLVKLEASDRIRHSQNCVVCAYPITGPWFKETAADFCLCSLCYSEGKVPFWAKKDDYCFKEYNSGAEAVRDKLRFFSLKT